MDGLNDVTRSATDFSVISRLARAGFSFSETVHVMIERYDEASAAVEAWLDSNERPMRRCYGRGRIKTAAEQFLLYPGYEADDLADARASTSLIAANTPSVWIDETELAAPDLDEFWRVDGILPLEGIGVIYGPPGSGKIFLAVDLGLSVAPGRQWVGKDVETTDAVYVASEGGRRAAKNRIIAWRTENTVVDTSRFKCLSANFALMDGADSFFVVQRQGRQTGAGRRRHPEPEPRRRR